MISPSKTLFSNRPQITKKQLAMRWAALGFGLLAVAAYDLLTSPTGPPEAWLADGLWWCFWVGTTSTALTVTLLTARGRKLPPLLRWTLVLLHGLLALFALLMFLAFTI